ncbi:MAG: motility associated factor glycosyltransferase family protein [Acidobacteria bacterium]|nr:motility associated factor glycosyltransferase family protein [Acidobacteriota bacterium]
MNGHAQFLRQNYQALAGGSSLLPPIDEIEQGTECVRQVTARNGDPTLLVRSAAGDLYLHSSYNPLDEGRLLAEDFDRGEADLIVLLGCGLGYHLESLLASLSPDVALVVIERDPQIFSHFLGRRDWRDLLKPFDYSFIVGADVPRLRAHLPRVPFFTRPLKPATWSHAPSVRIASEFYAEAERAVLVFLRDNLINIQTLLAHAPVFFENVIANMQLLVTHHGVRDLFGRFSGQPIILVGAGPSLDLNGHLLRRVHDRALIVAADTAIKPLLQIGVEPHLVVASDPMAVNAAHLAGLPPLSSVLVGEPSLNPSIFSGFPGDIRIYTLDEAPQRLLAEYFGEKGTLSAWGSVSTCALDLALKLGGDPIIFTGQDLAYTGSRVYCSGTVYEAAELEGMQRWAPNPDAYWAARIGSMNTIDVTAIDGRPTRTIAAMRGYASHMQQQMRSHPDRQFINATEGGILGPPAVPMPLAQVLRLYLREPLDVASLRPPAEQRSGDGDSADALVARLCASRAFLADAIERLPRLAARGPSAETLARFEDFDRTLKKDVRVYDLYALLERPAVWRFERVMKRLIWTRRGAGWIDEVAAAYRELYEALGTRCGWILDVLDRCRDRGESLTRPTASSS